MAGDARMIVSCENTWILSWEALANAPLALSVSPSDLWHFVGNMRRLTIDLSDPTASSRGQAPVDNLVNRCAVEQLTLVVQLPHPLHSHVKISGDPASPMWAEHCKTMQRLTTALAGRKFRDFFVVISQCHVDYDDYIGPVVTDCPSMGRHLDTMERWLERQVVERNVGVHRRTKHLEASVCPGSYAWRPDCFQCEMSLNLSNYH